MRDASSCEELTPDGRYRVEVTDASGKRISFISPAERDLLHTALG